MANKNKTKNRPPKKNKNAKKKPAPNNAARKRVGKRLALTSRAAKRKTAAPNKRVRGKSQDVDSVAFEPAGLGARSGGQSGDLQGLSNAGRANSESVDELLEEGNAFEAEVVKGVEDAGDDDEGEVHTHEVPEDDVPGEYLDKD